MAKRSENNILAGRFQQAVEKFSSRPALDIQGSIYTYSLLNAIGVNIALIIRNIGTTNPPLAGLLSAKSISAYAGIIGILFSSKGYVPLNPRFPVARSLSMIKSASLKILVVGKECTSNLIELLPFLPKGMHIILPDSDLDKDLIKRFPKVHFYYTDENEKADNVKVASTADSIAYLLFTSGSTGKPKGVPVTNKNVLSYLDFMSASYDFHPEDRFSQTFDLTFDLSVHDLFLCWLSGACLCIPRDNSSLGMAKYLKEQKPTVWFSVPSMVVLMSKMRLLKQNAFQSLRFSFFCGESLYLETAAEWAGAAPSSDLINFYGPTEATIAISSYTLKKDIAINKSLNGIVSIGKIFPTQKFRITNEGYHEVPKGKQGELCLSGSQVVQGYFRDKRQTSKSFFRIGGEENTWYKTGDLVVEDAEGDLFFLGRKDSEIKISGYRVNLLEIDHLLKELTHGNSAISTFEKASGKIVSFVAQKAGSRELGARSIEAELLERCRKRLPWYMVPERIIFVEVFPLNPNGKIDKKALIEKYAK